MRKMLLQGLVAVLAFFVFALENVTVSAEGPNDPAPILVPSDPNGKKVLFDNSHGQTAGQSDWVIDGAFSDFANALLEAGYTVKEHRSLDPLTLEDLEGYDVFIIPEAQIPFKKSEQDAIAEFAEQGGSVFFIADHYNADRNFNRWDSNEIMNGWRRGAFDNPTKGMDQGEQAAMAGVESTDWLSEEFGVRFRFNSIDNTTANVIIPSDESFGITSGIDEISIHAGSTLAIMNPEIAKGIVYLPDGLTVEENKWSNAVDEGVYFGGGIHEGPFVAIGKKERGKAAFIGDSSVVEDSTPKYRNEEHGGVKRTYDGFTEKDNGQLLMKIVEWLSHKESYLSFSELDIPLDQPSPILEMETPEHSEELKPEPWRSPNEGYLWYDQSTFADGSFGSEMDPPKDIKYNIETPEFLPTGGEPFQVTLKLTDMKPGQVIENGEIQVYLEGGTSISQVRLPNGTWPTTYGYQSVGSIQANQHGVAEKVLTMRLNPTVQDGTTGYIRLRIGAGNNVFTKTVNIGQSIVETPPGGGEKYQLLTPKYIPLGGIPFPVEVVMNGLTPGQTVANGQIQIYLSGGQSISQIQFEDGTWPITYGYFNIGKLTADENGKAKKTIMMRINPNVSAYEAYIRLRLGSGNNVLTQKVTMR
ncbi:DNA-binding protein [Aeribacillus composti]|uniref:DNA-binding protein n=1 Tax=Aeribacillus composti TaxID=1868734 RepID=UPI002E247C60|nr:DNA-binding protein [Aeribacillus composti]MED0744525.1 DNA-binding protein [Aeribacillus composti]